MSKGDPPRRAQARLKVRRRHVHKPAETAGELLDAYEKEPPPKAEPLALKHLLKQRGRR